MTKKGFITAVAMSFFLAVFLGGAYAADTLSLLTWKGYTPKNLVGMLGGGMIHIGLAQQDEVLRVEVADLSEVRSAAYAETPEAEGGLSMKVLLKVEAQTHANAALVQLIQLFNQRDVQMLSLETLEPNLESVFLHLTGKSLRQ